jgi:hypothetical protein
MSTTPHAASAAAARQQIAGVLATLQQDPNLPPNILEIVSGLAAAMGPLFQLERGSPDANLFLQARAVLQQTLERIQTVDQNYPGVSDATGAIAQSLGTIFQAMRAAGVVPGAAQAAPAQAPLAPPRPNVGQAAAPIAQPMMQAFPAHPQAQPAMQPPRQPQQQFAASPAPAAHPPPAASPQTGNIAAVPVGPNGVPRLESEVGVHSETNFYTDFLGDIRNHGGIFVATFQVLPVGSACEVLLTFPGNLTAEMRGVVRWKREGNQPGASISASPGLGIEITHANADAWNLIERFMRKREPIMHEM